MLIPSELNRFAAPPPDLSAVPEPELVRAARGGDDAAFGEIYRRYHTRLTKFACLRLHHWGESEDAAQEVLLKAWRVLSGTDARIERNLAVWLHRMTANKCIDVIRRRRNRPTVSAEHYCERFGRTGGDSPWTADDYYAAVDRAVYRVEQEHDPALALLRPSRYDDPQEAAELGERAAVLRGALDRLPGRYRAHLLAQADGGAEIAEIAAQEGATVAAVKATMWRARILLRAMPDVAALAP